jgi:Homoserine dehydrogenase
VHFAYEAAVCGGIPIINALQNDFFGDKITKICGIMNGTTNFMLSKMEGEGAAYDAVLKEAQVMTTMMISIVIVLMFSGAFKECSLIFLTINLRYNSNSSLLWQVCVCEYLMMTRLLAVAKPVVLRDRCIVIYSQ